MPWDPPLTIGATIPSPRRAAVVIDGDEHRVQGQELNDTVSRMVDIVREQMALSRRVSVHVDTGLATAPTRILVAPISSARFFYGDDDKEH